MTGDGGWAGLDQELAAQLAASGVPTVGLNSLKYFWTERTPGRDRAGRRPRHPPLPQRPGTSRRVLLVGYSFGADVLPFVVNRLPPDLRESVASVSLLGIDSNASFEIRIADWVGCDDARTADHARKSRPSRSVPVLCLYGEGEKDSICPGLPASGTQRASKSAPAITSAANTPPLPSASWPSRGRPVL